MQSTGICIFGNGIFWLSLFIIVVDVVAVVVVAVVVVAVAVAVVVVVVVAQNGTRRKVGPIGARVFHFRNSSPDFHHTFFFFLPGRGRIALRSFFRFPIFFFL